MAGEDLDACPINTSLSTFNSATAAAAKLRRLSKKKYVPRRSYCGLSWAHGSRICISTTSALITFSWLHNFDMFAKILHCFGLTFLFLFLISRSASFCDNMQPIDFVFSATLPQLKCQQQPHECQKVNTTKDFKKSHKAASVQTVRRKPQKSDEIFYSVHLDAFASNRISASRRKLRIPPKAIFVRNTGRKTKLNANTKFPHIQPCKPGARFDITQVDSVKSTLCEAGKPPYKMQW
jgi:hypothetical protein